MCYLTYYPIDAETVVFTSNRDENIQRSMSTEICQEPTKGGVLFYPKVNDTNGSWIMFRTDGSVAVLLNGAFVAHEKRASYRLSRGAILRKVFDYPAFSDFSRDIDLDNIEPFTVIFKSCRTDDFWELRWNGEQKIVKRLAKDLPLTWSSATLYSAEMQLKRDAWFKAFLQAVETRNGSVQPSDILHFQCTKTADDPRNALVMQRDTQQTVSLTQILVGQHFSQLFYKNLLANEDQILSF